MNPITKSQFINIVTFFLLFLFSQFVFAQGETIKDTTTSPPKTPPITEQILTDLWAQDSYNNIYNLNSGYVGIGTGNNIPQSRLTVWGSGWYGGALEINNGSGYYGRIVSASDGFLFRNFSSSAYAFSFRSNNDVHLLDVLQTGEVTYKNSSNAYLMKLKSDGKLGIGTTNPICALDVYGTGYAHFYGNSNPTTTTQGAYINWNALTGGTGETDFINNQGGGTGGFAFMNTPSSGSPRTTLMFIKGNGTVGIATTAPNDNYKLDVNGKIRANEVVVNTTGADFVFNDDYKIKTLNEVEKFIRENKHLPEIPSAEEMEKVGLSLSEMNTRLLQKVEELTLYIIEQEKRIQVLENKK